MLDLRGNIDNVSGGQCPCRFSVLLIPAASPRYKQDLSALVVDVPVSYTHLLNAWDSANAVCH